ncbi:MAG: hypothetical protein A2Z20_09435 [Bdellovibrionales bacterium RBG_16_40_8]|nr:MAG: hypothetical protein A2Z20_09435 [Bdellovibrionales bacterium RBG_16_40_8]
MSKLIVEGDSNYEFFTTNDGSPSICLSSDKFRPEAMHHRDGALAESLFVYKGVLHEALELGCPPRVLSLGIGCGYNEMIAVAYILHTKKTLSDFYLESFEGDTNLRTSFTNWLLDMTSASELQSEIYGTLNKVLDCVANEFTLKPQFIKSQLLELYEKKQFILREWLTSDTDFSTIFGVIFFDAFSSKSTPELWTENFLKMFLKKVAAPNCALATYAATGSLNRALKESNFILKKQKGFSGKRESTRALRLTNSVNRPIPMTMLGSNQ